MAEGGFRLVIVGAALGGAITKPTSLEGPPPGAGLNTRTLAGPAAAMSVAGITAVNCVLVTKVVGLSESFHRTTDPLTKFVPVTVRTKAGEPAVAVEGLRLVIVGAALGGVIVNVTALEVPPPGAGLNTVTLAVPAVAMSVAGIEAIS